MFMPSINHHKLRQNWQPALLASKMGGLAVPSMWKTKTNQQEHEDLKLNFLCFIRVVRYELRSKNVYPKHQGPYSRHFIFFVNQEAQ
jgi:hypothetical protein